MSIENPKLGLEGESQSQGWRQEVVLAMTSWWVKYGNNVHYFLFNGYNCKYRKCEAASQSELLTKVLM